jgi:quercetin dioxygenase-like cupin family protein
MTMTPSEPFMIGPAADRSIPWRTIVGGDRTGGGLSVGDARMPPRTPGPGRHVHTNEDEAIYVVSGVLTVEVGGERFEAGPESLVWMPRGVPHVFANLSDHEVWTVGVINPPGLEEMFRERDDYLAALDGPPDVDALMQLAARYGVYPVEGPPLE